MFLLFPILVLTLNQALASQHNISTHPQALAKEAKWIKLLHYQKGFLGGHKSQADGKGFFLHPEGKTNPVAELTKAIELFSSETKPNDDHAICKFPLRYKWLNQQLGNPWQADFSGCTRYIAFFSKLAAKRASIVFSSYFLSNPNSAFGHTLLRLSRYEDSNETEMLDYGINYSADAKGSDPFSYAVKGLTGGFKGKFAAIPYYYKIREYSNGEFRDLWSYDLKLSMPQVLEMVDHIWEMAQTDFDYYYFHENCSYHLLSVIDVVLPEKNLTAHFKYTTIPADTIRILKQEGLIDEGKKRESTYSKLSRLSRDLKVADLDDAKKIATHPTKTLELLKGKDDQTAANILDVSIEAFDYYNSKKILMDDKITREQKKHILEARAINPVITADEKSADYGLDSPALSHAPMRLGLYQGYEHQTGQQTRFEFRKAFHDLLDPPAGSLKDGELEMGRFALTHDQQDYQGGSFQLDYFSILSIKNLAGQDFWASPLSWEIALGAKQVEEISCLDCPGAFLDASIGNTLHLMERRFLVALLLNTDINVHNFFRENYRLGLGPKLYSRVRFSERLISGLGIRYHLNSYSASEIFQDQSLRAEWETRYHLNPDFSLALKATSFEKGGKWISGGELGLQYFY